MNNKILRLAIDADDAALELKRVILEHVRQQGFCITDLDYLGRTRADYPQIGFNLAMQIANKSFDRGVLICGTGLGMAMIANKVRGVFAGVCHDTYSAERLIKSNDAQIITMGARVIGPELAKKIIDVWLSSEFVPGPSSHKVEQMRRLESQSFESR